MVEVYGEVAPMPGTDSGTYGTEANDFEGRGNAMSLWTLQQRFAGLCPSSPIGPNTTCFTWADSQAIHHLQDRSILTRLHEAPFASVWPSGAFCWSVLYLAQLASFLKSGK